jgi:enamine deaminase RidA (YjgF/YER057c/UK114 family)
MTIERKKPGQFFSAIVIHNETVYLAGITPDNLEADVKEQTEEVLAKIDALLSEAGSDKSKLLKANIWVTDMRTFGQMNEAWTAWVDADNKPVRATVEAKLANPKILVEIMVEAAL